MTPEPYPTPWRWVDLGLPSGTLWLDRNVGANSPVDVGLYFMWGQLNGYKEPPGYDMSTEYVNLGLNSISNDLSLEHDAAAYYYGSEFRMASRDEFRELFNNSTTTLIGNYYQIVSNINGASIKIPVSGIMESEQITGAQTVLWTTRYDNAEHATAAMLSSSSPGITHARFRWNGLPIRPVKNS